jgi:hypothetical protein
MSGHPRLADFQFQSTNGNKGSISVIQVNVRLPQNEFSNPPVRSPQQWRHKNSEGARLGPHSEQKVFANAPRLGMVIA